MYRSRRSINRGSCEQTTYPVEVLPVDGGKKKIAYCLGCGRSGPACEGSTEVLMALRETPRPVFERKTA